MNKYRKLIVYNLIFLAALGTGGFGCASKNDLTQLREELMNNLASNRASMEQRLRGATTQIDVRKEQETATVQSHFSKLQQQIDTSRHSIDETITKMRVRSEGLEQVLRSTLLIEQRELRNRLNSIDKLLQDLDQTARGRAGTNP